MNYYDKKNSFKPLKESSLILDFTGCQYPSEIHLILKEKFGLPEYYGENWDALFDCLDDRFSEAKPYNISVYGYNSLPKELCTYCTCLLEIFDDICKENPNVIFKVVS